jgi:hypothetical protein
MVNNPLDLNGWYLRGVPAPENPQYARGRFSGMMEAISHG